MKSPAKAVPILVIAIVAGAAAAEWPKGYVAYQNTESPDGQYGIIVPTVDESGEPTEGEQVNYLANLKTHQVLDKIAGSDFYEHQNHAGLSTIWADDSSWCVVEYDGRFAFFSISILELKGSRVIQTDIGQEIDGQLTNVINKQTHQTEKHGMGGSDTTFRLGDDRKLRVRATATTDPKQRTENGGYYALFQGTFDVRTKKWLATDARPLKRDQFDASSTAFTDLDTQLEHTSFETQDKTQWLDERMNEVYNVVRVVLPPNRFAKIKQEQMEWLKKRDAVGSVEEKHKLMEARIRALQDLLW